VGLSEQFEISPLPLFGNKLLVVHMYSQQHARLHETVGFLQLILILIYSFVG
jgi:hypothetical protein